MRNEFSSIFPSCLIPYQKMAQGEKISFKASSCFLRWNGQNLTGSTVAPCPLEIAVCKAWKYLCAFLVFLQCLQNFLQALQKILNALQISRRELCVLWRLSERVGERL